MTYNKHKRKTHYNNRNIPNWDICSVGQEKDTIISISPVGGLLPWNQGDAWNH